jgi:hypothetical protein
MAIYRLIGSRSFGPDEIAAMAAAYEIALTDLRLIDRDDPLTEDIAKAIVDVTATGERDPLRIRERALHALGLAKPSNAQSSSELATTTAQADAKPPSSRWPARCPIPGRD